MGTSDNLIVVILGELVSKCYVNMELAFDSFAVNGGVRASVVQKTDRFSRISDSTNCKTDTCIRNIR